MSIVDKYLTQTAYVLEQLGTNRYGEYETVSKPIKCRLEMSQSYLGEITRALMITDYQAKALMFCKEPITLGQKVMYKGNEYTAIQVNEIINIDGSLSHYEVILA